MNFLQNRYVNPFGPKTKGPRMILLIEPIKGSNWAPTLEYQINVTLRLFIFYTFSSRYALIWSVMFIIFSIFCQPLRFLIFQTLERWHFLTNFEGKVTCYGNFISYDYYFLQNESPVTVIPSVTFIWYSRVHSPLQLISR